MAETQGNIRYAVHHLLTAWSDYDRHCADAVAQARREADTLARMLGAVPGGDALTTEVTDIMTAGTARAETELRQAGESYSTEARTLLGLLTGQPDLASAPFTLPSPGSGLSGIVATFPTIESRRYVEHVLTDHTDSDVITTASARSAASNGPSAPAGQVAAFAAQFPSELHEMITRMQTHSRSHALQTHGPDVTDDALKARLTWRKDPAGRTNSANRWALNDDGTVSTNHVVGPLAGKFTTMEAMAKPLRALLAATGNTVAGLETYLTSKAVGRTARIFVPAHECGLEPGDTAAYRGAGTQTEDMARDWAQARDFAMGSGADPMPIVPTDPIADGLDPGAAMSFRKSGDHWIMTTCYPVPTPDERFTRLRSTDS
ncbi:hypothetical protein [Haloactinopolyspora sp.]|uniref:hypothetical protein n=1 Tax=Haloactinopolyspora sp. TaxID=1966353 RepID=UPI00261F9357|nr:hypothetical protein [Haloactinopolyspora sp.]